MTKRDFLRALAIGAGTLAAAPPHAWADRIRLIPGEPGPRGPVISGVPSPDFRRFVGGVRVGGASRHDGLLVFWLHAADAKAAWPIATLEEARTRGDLLVTERAQATVPALIVENRGATPVLLLAGEILVGGKQHRVVIEDILLAPKSGPRDLAVYCVEQGRWAGRSGDFVSKGSFAAPQLRARVMDRADQGRVWAEVHRYARSAKAASPTESYQAIYDNPDVKAHQRAIESAVGPAAAPAAHGAAVFAGEAFVGLDLFQSPDLFARQWPKLLRAHALEVYGRATTAPLDDKSRRREVDDLLRRAARAQGALRENPGLGRLFEFRLEAARGSALIVDAEVVHTAIL